MWVELSYENEKKNLKNIYFITFKTTPNKTATDTENGNQIVSAQ